MTQGNTSPQKPNDFARFGVVWPRWLSDEVNKYCSGEERSRNWLIKKAVVSMLGLSHKIGDKPDERDEVTYDSTE